MENFFNKMFSSFKMRNYRWYFAGQLVSITGNFLQGMAQDWLILKLTNSGTYLGLVSACQFIPMLLLMPWGGRTADRYPKLRTLRITQTVSMCSSFLLGILVLTGAVQIWMVFIFAGILGITNSIDNPTRQAFVGELVGPVHQKNAVSLWATLISTCRIIGPAIAAILIAGIGMGYCFVVNSATYLFVLGAFFMIRTEDLHLEPVAKAAKGQIKEGFDYMRKNPAIYNVLILMAIVGTFTFEWQITLPLFAKFVLHGNATTLSRISMGLAAGMLTSGLYLAYSGNISQKGLVTAACSLGFFTLIASRAPTLFWTVTCFYFVGASMIMFTNVSNNLLRMHTEKRMQGRILSFWNMTFQGSTAIGGPLLGIIGQYGGARSALAFSGCAALLAGIYGFYALWKQSPNISK